MHTPIVGERCYVVIKRTNPSGKVIARTFSPRLAECVYHDKSGGDSPNKRRYAMRLLVGAGNGWDAGDTYRASPADLYPETQNYPETQS